jgi:hypothetical protein
MAGYIVKKDGSQTQFHAQNALYKTDSTDVVEVQLDGDELEHVREKMKGIRMTDKRVVTFFDEDAKFIIANW